MNMCCAQVLHTGAVLREEFKVHTPCDPYIMCCFFLRIKEHEMQMRIASACLYPCPKEAVIHLSRPGLKFKMLP